MQKTTFYTTLENQLRIDGTKGLPYHSAHLLQDDGRMIRQEIFDRRTIEEEA